MHTREIRTKDFQSILQINQESIPNVFELNTGEFSLLLKLCEYSKVVEIDNEIAGYLFVLGKSQKYDGDEYNWFCQNLSEEFLYIDQIAISGKWRGMGCGKTLYKDLEKYAIQNQKPALVCEVNCRPLNHASMAFHKGLGFKELHQMETREIGVSLLAKRVLTENA